MLFGISPVKPGQIVAFLLLKKIIWILYLQLLLITEQKQYIKLGYGRVLIL